VAYEAEVRTKGAESSGSLDTCLSRLVDFAEPETEDVCLDVSFGHGPVAAAIRPRVRGTTVVDVAPQPVRAADVPAPATVRADPRALPFRDHSFTMVTMHFTLYRLPDAPRVLREMLRVCRPDGRLIISDLIRTSHPGGDRDLLERLRDPDHPGTPSISRLAEVLAGAGAAVRRFDVFTIERPAEPWLTTTGDPIAATQLRRALTAEVDGGPPTGARPRVISGELWFSQSFAHVAAVPQRAPQPTSPQIPSPQYPLPQHTSPQQMLPPHLPPQHTSPPHLPPQHTSPPHPPPQHTSPPHPPPQHMSPQGAFQHLPPQGGPPQHPSPQPPEHPSPQGGPQPVF
jgi:SAM-dependent methyltransferase